MVYRPMLTRFSPSDETPLTPQKQLTVVSARVLVPLLLFLLTGVSAWTSHLRWKKSKFWGGKNCLSEEKSVIFELLKSRKADKSHTSQKPTLKMKYVHTCLLWKVRGGGIMVTYIHMYVLRVYKRNIWLIKWVCPNKVTITGADFVSNGKFFSENKSKIRDTKNPR